ncbi:MAG TPA: sulfite exporter TauE/SafE family protein [Phenylobacterium sp.]|jgi:hypothetical protein
MKEILVLLALVALWAGFQNALAGGGSFVTLPALILSGLDARNANIASTLALFPGQVTTGWVGRRQASGVAGLGFPILVAVSLTGGAIGAALLLLTPSSFFARLVPWLVLFATALFAYGSFAPPAPAGRPRVGPRTALAAQLAISIYGGYFGGGIGFLMLAALTAAGLAVRTAGATKNVLAGVMNAAAVAIFLFTPGIPWLRVGVIAVCAMAGGYIGAMAMKRIDERIIRGLVIALGVVLSIGLFLRQAH